jgi:hypothetical protein
MKVIIAGSRSINDYDFVKKAIQESGFKITEVISGRAKGVDRLGELYARENNIPIKQFRVDWNKYGRSAGIKRNIEMGDYADSLIAIWDGYSTGTQHMMKYANYKNLKVFVKINNDIYYKNFEKRFGDLMTFLNKQSWKLPKITAKDIVGV